MSSQLQVSGEAKIRAIQGPVVANSGVITALNGGATQYVRGDGTLADFPTSTGGGSSVSYYLNSSVSQGTIGGVAYRQLSKTPISGAGTDITISSNGYVASYITDANDPALLEVPAGNFNCEFYFSVNNNTGNPFVYAEVYKYDGTTFTLLGTSVGVPEYITEGTVINPYYFAVPVAVSALTITDRLAIRIYVNVDGRVVTLHTENNHLCQVVTTFSKGLISLNNLTRQNQFFATGTSGTDFNISSATATHTFNLPVASAANTGKLSSTDWSTFNGKVPYTGATANVELGNNRLIAGSINANPSSGEAQVNMKQTLTGNTIYDGFTSIWSTGNNFYIGTSSGGANSKSFYFDLSSLTNITTRTYSLPDLSGTLALLESAQTFTGKKTFSNGVNITGDVVLSGGTGYGGGIRYNQGIIQAYGSSETTTEFTDVNSIKYYVGQGSGNYKNFVFDVLNITLNATRTFTLPDLSGTLALTSDLGAYVTLATAQDISGNKTFTSLSTKVEGLGLKLTTGVVSTGGYLTLNTKVVGTLHSLILAPDSATNRAEFTFDNTAIRTYALPNASGTIALLSGTQTFTGATTFSSNITVNSVQVGSAGNTTNIKLGDSTFGAITTGSNNIAIGTSALTSLTTSNANIGIGNSALASVVDGAFNTAIGFGIGGSITSGSNNALFGYGAGSSITTGNYNTIIGAYAGTAAMDNNIVLADGAGTIRYQWNGTNNVFGNPISGTSATFSSSVSIGTSSTGFNAAGLPLVVGSGSGNTGLTIFSGASSAGSIHFADAETTGAASYAGYINYSHSANSMQFGTNSNERMTILSDGNVGIGTSSITPIGSSTNRALAINAPSGNASMVLLQEGGTTYGYVYGYGGDAGLFTSAAIPLIFGTNSVEKIRITSGGNVLIGATAAAASVFQFQVGNGTADTRAYFNPSNAFALGLSNSGGNVYYLGVGTSGAAGSFQIYSNTTGSANFSITSGGVITIANLAGTGSRAVLADASGNLSAPVSDISVKQNISTIGYGLNEILKMNPVWFDFIDDYKNYGEGRQNGMIAQEVAEVIPEAVFVTPSTGKMGINYDQMHAVYIKAIQELKLEIEILKNK